MQEPEKIRIEEHKGKNLFIKGVEPGTYEKFRSCCKVMDVQSAELFSLIFEDFWRRKGRHLKAGPPIGRRVS